MNDVNTIENRYKLGEFAGKIGVFKGTVRNWQKRGLLSDRRSYNNYRYFTDEDIDTALKLLKGN